MFDPFSNNRSSVDKNITWLKYYSRNYSNLEVFKIAVKSIFSRNNVIFFLKLTIMAD